MVYYRIEAKRIIEENDEKMPSFKEKQILSADIAEKSENLFNKTNGDSIILTASIKENNVVFAAISKTSDDITVQFEQYIKNFPIRIDSYKIEETIYSVLTSLLTSAFRNGYIKDDDEILKKFNILNLNSHRDCFFGEAIIDDTISMDECRKNAKDLLFDNKMLPELDRIAKTRRAVKALGHPVHYIVTTNDTSIRKTICKTLLSALYINGRIKNKRYSFLDYNNDSDTPAAGFDALYSSSEGGVVIVRYTAGDEVDSEFAKQSLDIVASICETAIKYKNKVLTVFCIPTAAKKIKEEFLSHWGSTSFIELEEDIAFYEKAKDYLKAKAAKQKIRIDKKLIACVDADKSYTASELNRIFDDWYSKKLRNEIYSQYKTVGTLKESIKDSEPCGTAYQKLESLIGLKNAKNVMNNILNYFKAQKLFADRGMVADTPTMHMVFTGNPGTAKTTVARLFAKIMKENGLLKNGSVYEVGRADIVGKYVGSTAPLVKLAFKRAKGGVLFIDEAYSLVDKDGGLYGDEAINTIVQEMENDRKDTVVIFAGYPDKMESFLNKNPGLRSRIAFHIPFDDYSASELCDIAGLIASEKNLKLSDEALRKLEYIFESARVKADFGNGRFARNIIEKAKMEQANRLMKMDLNTITDDDLKTITAEDIDCPGNNSSDKKSRIGFTV